MGGVAHGPARLFEPTYNSYGTLTEDEQLEAISNIGQTNSDLQNVSMDDILAEVARRKGR